MSDFPTRPQDLTVAELREALVGLPDDASVVMSYDSRFGRETAVEAVAGRHPFSGAPALIVQGEA